MRQKHATCDKFALCKRAYSGLFVRHAAVACGRKKVEIIQLSCDSMQKSHVAQISPFTQRDFVARRMFLSHRVNTPLIVLLIICNKSYGCMVE